MATKPIFATGRLRCGLGREFTPGEEVPAKGELRDGLLADGAVTEDGELATRLRDDFRAFQAKLAAQKAAAEEGTADEAPPEQAPDVSPSIPKPKKAGKAKKKPAGKKTPAKAKSGKKAPPAPVDAPASEVEA